jgi:hypothetical protein
MKYSPAYPIGINKAGLSDQMSDASSLFSRSDFFGFLYRHPIVLKPVMGTGSYPAGQHGLHRRMRHAVSNEATTKPR